MIILNSPNRIADLEADTGKSYYILPTILAISLAYAGYLVFDQPAIREMGIVGEDGLYEYLTAFFFGLAFIFFVKAAITYRNLLLFLLGMVMFLGAGEEISWGQRVIGFDTPDWIMERNVQREFTLHNLEFFNNHDFEKNEKTGLAKLVTINFLYKLFWLGYGVFLPIAFGFLRPVARLSERLAVPIPPLSIGAFFLLNWLAFRLSMNWLIAETDGQVYRYTEVMEAVAAYVFMLIALFFVINGPTRYMPTQKSKDNTVNADSLPAL